HRSSDPGGRRRPAETADGSLASRSSLRYRPHVPSRDRGRALVLCIVVLVASGCPATHQLRLAPEGEAVARLTEQHDVGEGQVLIWRLDGERIRESNPWRRIDLDLEIVPGPHVVECSFFSSDMHSTQNGKVAFTAEAGRHYTVRATGVKEGFWKELGKRLQTAVWPASTTWVAWIEDASSGTVVGGVKPTHEGLFSTALPAGGANGEGVKNPPPPPPV